MLLKFMNPYLLNLTLNKLIRVFTVACLAAVLFISCEQSNGEIGSGKFSDNRPELGEKLSYPVVSYTSSWDSISTKSPSRVVLGNLNDPIFGAVNLRLVLESYFQNRHQILVQELSVTL